MLHSRFLLILFASSFTVQLATAQKVPIQLDFDTATFAYDDEYAVIETYLAFEASTLAFEQDGETFRSSVPVYVDLSKSTLSDSLESALLDTLSIEFVVPDTSYLAPGQYFVHQERNLVYPGEYSMELTIPEDDSRPAMVLRRDIVVTDYTDESVPGISDVTLAMSLEPSENRENPFYKNGVIIRPNASQLFGSGLETLYYYGEIYNLPSGSQTYTLLSMITEANQVNAVADLQQRTERNVVQRDPIVGQFDVSMLPSGSYFLRLVALGPSNEALVEQTRKFFVYNPAIAREEPEPVEITFEQSEFAGMTEEEVDMAFKRIAVISTNRERRRAKSIKDLEDRKRYLMDFWAERDPNPATPINEFRDEFHRRIQFANERYSSAFKEGWESNRGEVIMKYGLPTGIEPHLYDSDSIPYEIWEYSNIPGEGQSIFVFGDRSGFGEFELIHSTVTGERSLPNWQEELRKG